MITHNPFVNPMMEVSQGATSILNASDGSVAVDRWTYNKIGSFQHVVLRDTDVPPFSLAGKYIPNSYRLNLTTAQNSIGSADECIIVQKIEGYRFREFAWQPFDLVFWVKADLVGTYCVSLRNNVPDLSCIGEFTINQADTWEEKRITFPASPTSGTWNYSDGVGVRVGVVVMAGSSFQSVGNQWVDGYYHRTANQVNGVQNGAVNFRITDFDIVSVGAGRHQFRSHAEEYELCRRYRRRYTNMASGTKFLSGIVDTASQASFDIMCEGMAPVTSVSCSGMGVYDVSVVSNITGVNWFASAKDIVSFSVATTGGLSVAKPAKIRSDNASSYLEIKAIE